MIPENIKTKIEDRFGRKVLYSKDCDSLSKSIEKACNNKISTTTLKRIFGFAQKIDQPRLYTLDVLATYVGYNDWSSLLAQTEKVSTYSSITKTNTFNKNISDSNTNLLYHHISVSLSTQSINNNEFAKLCKKFGKRKEIFPFLINMITIATHNRNIQFLKTIFNNLTVFDLKVHEELDFYFIGQTMGLMLRIYPDIAAELIPTLSTSKNAQRYFIEWFVDEDNLNGYYGKLLDAYHKQKNKENADKIFYYCLKYRQAYHEGNVIDRVNWYKKLKRIPLALEVHPIPAGRYIGICISEEPSHYCSNSSPYYSIISNYINPSDYEKTISFLLYLYRELFKSRRTDWLVQIIRDSESQFKEMYKLSSSHWGIKIENQLLIYVSYGNFLLGDYRKANFCFNRIDSNLFEPFIYNQIHRDYTEIENALQEKKVKKSARPKL